MEASSEHVEGSVTLVCPDCSGAIRVEVADLGEEAAAACQCGGARDLSEADLAGVPPEALAEAASPRAVSEYPAEGEVVVSEFPA